MEYFEDYDVELQYHLGKANAMADALSRKSRGSLAYLSIREWKTLGQIREFEVELVESDVGSSLHSLVAQPTIIQQVLSVQQTDEEVIPFVARLLGGEVFNGWTYDPDHGLKFHDRLFVPSSI